MLFVCAVCTYIVMYCAHVLVHDLAQPESNKIVNFSQDVWFDLRVPFQPFKAVNNFYERYSCTNMVQKLYSR